MFAFGSNIHIVCCDYFGWRARYKSSAATSYSYSLIKYLGFILARPQKGVRIWHQFFCIQFHISIIRSVHIVIIYCVKLNGLSFIEGWYVLHIKQFLGIILFEFQSGKLEYMDLFVFAVTKWWQVLNPFFLVLGVYMPAGLLIGGAEEPRHSRTLHTQSSIFQ